MRAPRLVNLKTVHRAWLITLLMNFAIGCGAFFLQSSTKLMEVWLVLYFVFSGYMVPVELFPRALREAVDVLPFRYQLGLPVEIVIGLHGREETLGLLARQWTIVLVVLLLVVILWRRGVARYEAFGG